eukprot:1140176-Pelagomonas_calceolata.AAC.3
MECAAEKKPRTLLREIMAAETQAARLPLEGSLTGCLGVPRRLEEPRPMWVGPSLGILWNGFVLNWDEFKRTIRSLSTSLDPPTAPNQFINARRPLVQTAVLLGHKSLSD